MLKDNSALLLWEYYTTSQTTEPIKQTDKEQVTRLSPLTI